MRVERNAILVLYVEFGDWIFPELQRLLDGAEGPELVLVDRLELGAELSYKRVAVFRKAILHQVNVRVNERRPQ